MSGKGISLPGPPSSPKGLAQPRGCGRRAALSQQPGTSGQSLVPSCSCSKPITRLPPREKSRQDQRLGCRRAPLLATESRWGELPGWRAGYGLYSPCVVPKRVLSPGVQKPIHTHCSGTASSGEAEGRKVREFCCIQHCAEHRSRVSAAMGDSTLHRSCSLLATAQAPSGDPSATDLALAQGPCHRPRC